MSDLDPIVGRGGFSKKQVRKDIATARKAKERAEAKRLRAEIKTARAGRKPALREVRAACGVERVELRTRCAERLALVRATVNEIVARNKTALAAAADAARDARIADAFVAGRGGPKVARAVRRAESDDAVRSNIDPYLVPYFDRVRSSIKGTPYNSRTEAFMQLVHDTPDDVASFMADNADEEVDRMVAEYQRRTNPRRRRNPEAARTATEHKAVKKYRALHWGNEGEQQIQTQRVPDPGGTLIELGRLREISYEADKKGDGPSLYTHRFSSRSKGKFGKGLAFLCVNEVGGLVIVGGGYDVENRGIVG